MLSRQLPKRLTAAVNLSSCRQRPGVGAVKSLDLAPAKAAEKVLNCVVGLSVRNQDPSIVARLDNDIFPMIVFI